MDDDYDRSLFEAAIGKHIRWAIGMAMCSGMAIEFIRALAELARRI